MARILPCANGTSPQDPNPDADAPPRYTAPRQKSVQNLDTGLDPYVDFVRPEELRARAMEARQGTYFERANGNCDLRDSNAGSRWEDIDSSITFLGHVRQPIQLPQWIDIQVLRWMKDSDFVAVSERRLVREHCRSKMKDLFTDRLGFPDLDRLGEEELAEPGFVLFIRYIQGLVESRINALGEQTVQLGIWRWDSDTTRKWDRSLIRQWDEPGFDGTPRAREGKAMGIGTRRTTA